MQSHPMRVCGLKPNWVAPLIFDGESHPMRVCGLKLQVMVLLNLIIRHTLCGCVD